MNKKIFELKYNLSQWDKYTLHTKLWCSIWHARHVSISVTKTVQKLSPATFWNVQICHLQIKFNVHKYIGISIHCIQNWPGTKKNIFIHLRWWYDRQNIFLLVCEPENSPEITTSPTSICCTSGSYSGPTLFFCTSLVDIMTLLQKKNYQNLGLLFSGI